MAVESKDHFEFIIGKAVLDLENAPNGGWRFPVEARLAGYVFIRFAIDIAAGDAWLEPHELVQAIDWFGFAGIGRHGYRPFHENNSLPKNYTPIHVRGKQ